MPLSGNGGEFRAQLIFNQRHTGSLRPKYNYILETAILIVNNFAVQAELNNFILFFFANPKPFAPNFHMLPFKSAQFVTRY